MGATPKMSATKIAADVQKEVKEFKEEWDIKFDQLAVGTDKIKNGVAAIAAGVAQNLGAIKANLDMNSDAIEQFDIFNQIWARMLIRVIERVEQTDHFIFQNLNNTSPNPEDAEKIKVKAGEWFEATFKALKEQVLQDRQAYMDQRRAEAEQAAKAEEQAKKEESTAEETLRGAEQSISTPGGQGSDIPAEAEVFGG